MKKIALLVTAALFLVGQNSFGQDQDTSKIRIGNKQYKVIVEDDNDVKIIKDDTTVVVQKHHQSKKHKQKMDGLWEGFDLGLTNFMNADYQFQLPNDGKYMDLKVANSLDWNFNFAEKSFGIVKNYIGFVTGLGLEYQNYRFTNDFSLTKADDHILADPTPMELTKNRLSIWRLNMPLMVEFQIPVYGESERIKLSAGVIGGLRIGSRQVQKYVENGEKQKVKIKDDFYLRDFTYGFTARVGYGDFAVFANYYPQTLFKDCMGPAIYPVTIGLHFGS